MWLKWRVMLGIGIVPPAIIVMCLTFLPESPRWLISRGRIREGYKVSERTEQLSPYPAEVRMSQYAASLRYLDGIWCVRAACVNLRVWYAAAFTLCAAWLDTEPNTVALLVTVAQTLILTPVRTLLSCPFSGKMWYFQW